MRPEVRIRSSVCCVCICTCAFARMRATPHSNAAARRYPAGTSGCAASSSGHLPTGPTRTANKTARSCPITNNPTYRSLPNPPQSRQAVSPASLPPFPLPRSARVASGGLCGRHLCKARRAREGEDGPLGQRDHAHRDVERQLALPVPRNAACPKQSNPCARISFST